MTKYKRPEKDNFPKSQNLQEVVKQMNSNLELLTAYTKWLQDSSLIEDIAQLHWDYYGALIKVGFAPTTAMEMVLQNNPFDGLGVLTRQWTTTNSKKR